MEKSIEYLGIGYTEKPELFTGVGFEIEGVLYYFEAKPYEQAQDFFIYNTHKKSQSSDQTLWDVVESLSYIFINDTPIFIFDNKRKLERIYHKSGMYNVDIAIFANFWIVVLDSLSKYQNIEVLADNLGLISLKFYNPSDITERVVTFVDDPVSVQYAEGWFYNGIIFNPETEQAFGIENGGIIEKDLNKSILPPSKIKEIIKNKISKEKSKELKNNDCCR